MLTVVTLILRAVGVSFNAYIANKIGTAGMGLFSLVMSFYNFGVTFACSGINLTATKIISEEIASGADNGVRRAVLRTCIYGFVFGSMAFLIIFFGAHFIGDVFLNDERTVLPLMILSVSLPYVAMSSAINGYFTAVGRIYKSAISQIFEQLIRVVGCIALLNISDSDNAQTACRSIVMSGSIAEMSSFIIIFLFLKFDIKRYTKNKSGKNLTRRMLRTALPLAVSSYVRSFLSTVEHTMIPRGLKKHGGDSNVALSSYGMVHGMVMPLIFFPSAVLQAFSSLLIPEVTMHNHRGNTSKINYIIEKALYITLVFSVGAGGILFFFAEEIGMVVYGNREVGMLIKIISPLSVIMYADGVVDAVLKGLDQQVYSMGYNIADSAIAIILMIFLLPAKGLEGYIFTIYITETLNAFLSINRLLHVSDFKIKPLKWAAFPSITIYISAYFVKSFANVFEGKIGITFLIILCLLVYTFVMLLFLYGGKIKRIVAKDSFV